VGEMTHCLVFWGGLEAGFFFPRGGESGWRATRATRLCRPFDLA
jgi:hypothetical protein